MSYEGARFCGLCDQPIRPGEEYDTEPIFSPSGPGGSVDRHIVCTAPLPPTQTRPAGWSRRR